MFKPAFPKSVSFSLVEEADFANAILHQDERALIESASEKRIVEFTLGRVAARNSLAALGRYSSKPLLRGSRGQPLWPPGITGAITHTRTIAAAATSEDTAITAIGLDLEYLDRNVADRVSQRICTPAERAWLEQSPKDRKRRILQIFSAKEAFYKAVNPLVGVPIHYLDVTLDWQHETNRFVGDLLRDLHADFSVGFTFEIHSEESNGGTSQSYGNHAGF